MKLSELRYFVAVADAKNISAAARKLYVSQPNLSRMIKNLERKMGKKLFLRTTQGVKLTATGKEVYFYAQTILSQLEVLENFKKHEEKRKLIKLKLNVAGLVLKKSLILETNTYFDNPYTELDLLETDIETAVKNVMSKKTEGGILVINNHQMNVFKKAMQERNLTVRILDTSYIYIHCGQQHPLAKKANITFEHLRSYPLIYTRHEKGLHKALELEYQKAIQRKVTVYTNYYQLVNLLTVTDTYTLGNKWQLQAYTECNLVSMPLKETIQKQSLVFIKRKNEDLSADSLAFINLFKASYHC